MAKKKGTRAPREKQSPGEEQAHKDLLQAGLGFYNISAIGDTSQTEQQAAYFSQYAISQGLDPETDVNGLPRQIELFGKIITEEQEKSRKNLITLTDNHFDYALDKVNGPTAVGLAAKLGTTKEEVKLEEVLSTPETELKEIKEAFSGIYEPSSLVSTYIALNTNKEEVARAAYGALSRAERGRQREFMYMDGENVRYSGAKAKGYISKNIGTADKEISDTVKIKIGLNLASKEMEKNK